MSKGLVFAGVLFSATLLGAQAHAASITNGDFEDTTNFTDNTGADTDSVPLGSTALTGWTILNHNVSWVGPANPFHLSHNGGYFLDLTDYHDGPPYGGIEQTISTVAGAHYTLSFDLGADSGLAASGILATAGTTSHDFVFAASAPDQWETEFLSFVATGASTTISLVGSAGSQYVGLDNVRIALATTPIPGSLLLFGSALGGMGLLARRRRLAAL